ncbi:MAG: arsenite methyltransferase [Nitrospinota bacterium]
METEKRPQDPDEVREMVKEGYARVAEKSSSCCCGPPPHAAELSRKLGYTDEELQAVPEGANLGVGCGNPTALASLRPGEVVVDLGSGAGMDVFLAARQVGPAGRVIGVDMTDEMLEKARKHAEEGGFENVEFRKGQIEDLPLDSESADVIISNCVINLSPEKDRVFREAYRVLRPGGRLMVSDLVLERPLPPEVLDNIEAYLGCVGGAALRAKYLEMVEGAGFRDVKVIQEGKFADAVCCDDPQVREAAEKFGVEMDQVRGLLKAVTSLHLHAVK